MGAICCSNSLDRKDDSFSHSFSQSYKPPNSKNYQRKYPKKTVSPGKPTSDSDTLWEVTDDLIT